MGKGSWASYFDAMKGQDWEGARKTLLSLLDTEKDKPHLYLKIGDVDQRLGLTDNAIAAYHRAAALFREEGFLQKAAAVCAIVLRLVPDDREALALSRTILADLEPAAGTGPRPAAQRRGATGTSGAAAIGSAIPPFLAGTPKAAARDFLRGLAVRSFSDGDVVVSENDSGDTMYVIRTGRARVLTHLLDREVDLGTLGPNDIFGEVSFLSGRRRTASVVAAGPLETWELGAVALERLVSLNPAIVATLEALWQSRARATISRARGLRERG